MDKEKKPLRNFSHAELVGFSDSVIGEYAKMCREDPFFAKVVLSPKASLEWIQENIESAKAYVKNDGEEKSADHLNNLAWLYTLEAWKKGTTAKSLMELEDLRFDFSVKVQRMIATILRYWQLASNDFDSRREELKNKRNRNKIKETK